MFLWKKSHPIVEMMEEYFERAEECINSFKKGFKHYIDNGPGGEFDGLINKTHMFESSCDDIRRKVEAEMFEKSLIPESREDILHLLEIIDKVPSKAESILFMMQTEFLEIPEKINDKFLQLVDINVDSFIELIKACRSLFEDRSKVKNIVDFIDKEESSSDHLEREIIRKIFSSEDIAPDQRILLKELIIEIGKISDKCEVVADTITIITVKRMI